MAYIDLLLTIKEILEGIDYEVRQLEEKYKELKKELEETLKTTFLHC